MPLTPSSVCAGIVLANVSWVNQPDVWPSDRQNPLRGRDKFPCIRQFLGLTRGHVRNPSVLGMKSCRAGTTTDALSVGGEKLRTFKEKTAKALGSRSPRSAVPPSDQSSQDARLPAVTLGKMGLMQFTASQYYDQNGIAPSAQPMRSNETVGFSAQPLEARRLSYFRYDTSFPRLKCPRPACASALENAAESELFMPQRGLSRLPDDTSG